MDSFLSNNELVLEYLRKYRGLERSTFIAKNVVSASPDSVASPYTDLNTHPELVRYLWDEIASTLPQDCRWIAYGVPVLFAPNTRKIFAFVRGTKTCAVLLSTADYVEAIANGAESIIRYRAYPALGILASEEHASEIGPGWIFCYDNPHAASWCLAAYTQAQ